jgi:hypothetical protein
MHDEFQKNDDFMQGHFAQAVAERDARWAKRRRGRMKSS